MKLENLRTSKQKIQYLKDVYGIEGDLFNRLMREVLEDLMGEMIGGESAMNEPTLKEMTSLIDSIGI